MQLGQSVEKARLHHVRRRVVAWPLAAGAQQATMPVIGILSTQSPEGYVEQLRAFRQGLKEVGYVEGEERRDRVPLGR